MSNRRPRRAPRCVCVRWWWGVDVEVGGGTRLGTVVAGAAGEVRLPDEGELERLALAGEDLGGEGENGAVQDGGGGVLE